MAKKRLYKLSLSILITLFYYYLTGVKKCHISMTVPILCSDYYHLKRQIESEVYKDGLSSKNFLDLSKKEQHLKLKERLKKYNQKVYIIFLLFFWIIDFWFSSSISQAYRRVLDKPITEVRQAGICMRENSFYVDTVRRLVAWTFIYLCKLTRFVTNYNPIPFLELI